MAGEKTVRENISNMISDTAKRFAASEESKKIMKGNASGNRLKDIALGKRVSALNKAIKEKTPKDLQDVIKTRNNELAKSVALYAVPTAGAVAGGIAIANKIKKRKGEKNMEKMSAEQYTEFIDKLADEIIEGEMEHEASYEEGYDGFDEEAIVDRACAAFEAAQMRKEAAEADFETASAYEDAALAVLDELGLLD